MPQHGQIAIFDRSWYGRVLVERIEGFATKDEWSRAYEEINNFEKILTAGDYIIIKFWLHVSDEEQLKRFKEREQNPYKSWKLTAEDWRNRDKTPQYIEAANAMFEKTDKKDAPWVLVAGDDKKYARVQVLQETIAHIEREAQRRGLHLTNVLDNTQLEDADSSSLEIVNEKKKEQKTK